ncbi:hypothetical protein L6452_13624 [Arctium lappa]|uniref:Uncharacterized protein n=1 Tax=Arctium lappa TaxID=4217 RepID=A0ACB9CIP2_ARCLA|nr:hypothetical protein L6452_13624 [Arctium lappa]
MWCLSLFLSDLSSHVWRNVFPHVSTILGNSHWVVGAGNISFSMANWGAGAFSVQNVDLNTPFREVIQSADFSTLVLPSLSTEAQSILSRLFRYDLPSSSYRSYSRFIPIRCYDVPYSNSGDSRRSIALFTIEPLGYDALLLEYHGIEYPDLPEAPEKAISAFRTVKGNSYSHAHRKKWCRTAGSYGTIACTKAGLGGLSHRWFGIANSSLFYVFLVGMLSAFRVLSIINARPMSGILEQMNSTQVEDAAGFVLSLPGWVKAILAWIETVLLFREIHNNDHQQPTSLDCRHEMPIKSVKGSLIKAGKQEDLERREAFIKTYDKRRAERGLLHDPPNPAKLINAA